MLDPKTNLYLLEIVKSGPSEFFPKVLFVVLLFIMGW